MPSGLACSRAETVGPASILPRAGYCSATISAPGTLLFDETLEHFGGRLAVFVVGRDDGPALGARGLRLLDQHADLHEIVGTDAEGVAVALRHRDGVGERLGGDVDDLLLVGVIRHGDADIRQERAEQQRHALAGDELVGDSGGIAGGASVIA